MLTIENLKKLLHIAKDLKKQLALATLFGSLGHLTVVLFTFLLAKVFLGNNWTVYLIAIFALLLAFAKGFFSYSEQLLNHYVAFKILHILRLKVMEKFKKISMSNFSKNSSGDYMTIINTDIEILEVFYAHTITPFLIYIIQTFVVTVSVAIVSPKLAIFILLMYIIMGIIVPLTTKDRGEKYGDDYRENLKNITTDASEETYSIFETMQYNKINSTTKKFEEETKKLTDSSYKKARFLINLTFLNTIIYNVSIIIFIILATKYITSTDDIIALAAMYMVSFTPILYIGNISSTLSQTMAAGSRFIKLLEMSEEKLNKGNVVNFDKLEVKNLNFAYNDKDVIKNLSFSAKKGEIVGIVGDSGSGKSTLAKLIMKLIPEESNSITIDNISINNIDNKFFRENSSIIMQDSYLFNSTLAKNVILFDKSINKNKLYEVFDNTNLTNFVNSLEKKEDSIISERSSNISSGQKQRLSTTRSLYNNSQLLILDEATANIDIFSEIELLKTLEKIKKDKIILIISHNKSTLSICDKVVTMG